MAIACFLNERWHEAAEYYHKAEQIDKVLDPESKMFLAVSLWRIGDKETAISSYADAAAKFASLPAPQQLSADRERMIDDIIAFDKQQKSQIVLEYYDRIDVSVPSSCKQRGRWHHLEGRHELAATDLTAAFEAFPDIADVHSLRMLGDSQSALQRFALAVEAYTKSLEIDVNDTSRSRTLSARAGAYRQLGELDLALADCSASIPLRPDESSARHHYLQRARIYCDLRQYQNALEDCQQSLDIDLDNDTKYYFRKDAYELRGDIFAQDLKQVEKAIAEFEKAIELDPSNADLKSKRNSAAAQFAKTN